MALQGPELAKKHELRFDVLGGVNQSPIDTEVRDDDGVEVITLKDVHWLNDGQIEFGLRNEMPGRWPVVSNRPNDSGRPLNGEVLMYDHVNSAPLSGRLEYYPVTRDGILEVLRDGEPCTIQLRYVLQIGNVAVHTQEEAAEGTQHSELAEAA